ncbi:MAG: hypothetical protein QFF03_09780 [Pseudomonadota bacterium]|nr:hypothetical protein [Pseudomonadota bacterium]
MNFKLKNSAMRQAAKNAVSGPKPEGKEHYTTEIHIGQAAKAMCEKKPYFVAERRQALTVAACGALGLVTCFWAGWSTMTVGLAAASIVTIYIGINQGVYKKYPLAVTHDTIDEANSQLIESGEQHQVKSSVVAEVFTGVLCTLDGFLSASAIVSKFGASVLSPRMAMGVGATIGLILTAALWVLLKAAASEKRKAEARQSIRELEQSEPDLAARMKQRLGAVLNYSYGPRHDSIRMRAALVCLVLFMASTSFVLRLESLIESQEKEQQIKEELKMLPTSAPVPSPAQTRA